MRVPRIYTPQTLSENTLVELDEHASHHCVKVLRMQTGRELIVFNGEGGCYPATIVKTNKKTAFVETGFCDESNLESPLRSHLAIAVSRGERFDFVLQKATELGVTEITPLLTERTEVKLSGERLAKKQHSWQKILISACEQCGRNSLPKLNALTNFTDFVSDAKAEQKFVLHHRNAVSPQDFSIPQSVVMLIGPEGGLSEEEILQSHDHQFQNLALGPRVLRTETAPLAALAIMQQLWGDI